ncbi:hypothetical protein DSM106972_035180 [Dulcicalothrix desertica PCC 7102]|uniref:histidine kinase n=1 Tax=Dulcicalothrix desertica PCC 7102 TaxID=232991 RepID=A0A433VHD4_9CYAN|nr:PAS domain S-box protein [Dulcicalothrix desertica]RUT05511.1 hypothetical protein DSM106972_035180 [Dulcicalothrix desertica PCC 7102]TWH54610.1 hypothetical protein CAL7102_02657 [Dulcicalothrix desertica PCC 7102]
MSATAPQAERVPYKQLRDGKEIPSEELPMSISAKQGIEIRNSEIQIVRADGISFDLLVNTKPLFDAQQKVRGCIAAFMDITEQKLALSALQESEALFRGIFDSALIGILVWNSQGQITNANNAFIKMTGYTREDLQAGKISFKNITPKEYHEADVQKIELLYKNGEYKPFEKEYICKDGSRIPVLIGCTFLPGYQDRGVAFCLDISERKRSEQERERLLAEAQAARTEAIVANQTKDEFLAIVSHELRAPLNSILGWAKLLQTRPFDQATAKRALETIERNAKSQSQLIEDLLDISRMIKGNLRLEKAPVNLIEVIETSINIVSPTALTKQINLEFAKNNETNTPLIVCGDFNRLQQVVLNLLTNAVKFTPNQGQVRIELSRSETPTHPHLHSAIIKVRDTGKGINSDFLPYVFERFRQASNSSRAKDGLGLGLAIVRNLVELHHGTVTAASPGKDQGATFTVILPILVHGE